MLRRAKTILSISLALLALPYGSATDFTLQMKNGDALTGEVIGEDESTIVVKIDYLGEVALPKESIANLDEWHASASAQEVGPSPADAGVDSVKEAVLSEKEEEKEKPDRLAWLDVLSVWVPFQSWDRSFQVGMTSQTGRTRVSSFNWRFDMNVEHEKNQYRFSAAYNESETNEVQTADRLDSSFRWRQDLGPGYFYQTHTQYFSDEIKRIDLNLEQNLGLGVRLIDEDDMTLSAGAGASGRWRDSEVVRQELSEEVIYLVDLFQDWDYQITDRLRLRQDLQFAMPLKESDEFQYRFTTALVSQITEMVNVSLRYEIDYDRSLVPASREDRRFVGALGYKF